MSDIVEQLRDRSLVAEQEGEPLALLDDAADEIARLHGVNDRLRAEIERLRAMVFRPITLTDAEREAVEWCLGWCEGLHAKNHATLRGLLERLSGSPSISGTGKSAQTGNAPEPAIPPATESGEK